MRNLLQPTASGRTAEQEQVLLQIIANGGVWPRLESIGGSRRRRRKSPKPVSGGPRRMVLLNSKGEPFTRMQGLQGLVSDAIASESVPAKRNGHAAAHTPATHDHPHRAAAKASTAMVSGRTQPWRIRRRKR